MKLNKYTCGNRFWIDTSDYDYYKLKKGDVVICINSTSIGYASNFRFGEIKIIENIDILDKRWFTHYNKYYQPKGYIGIGTITFEKIGYNINSDAMERFILLSDYKIFMRKLKLDRILENNCEEC
ncbi:hypothetical protein M0Q97_12295 [Candidatus Dojkabacteria bacterium]|jgi:hypothetical protein|nr:hypothetical protein [Candidatus Dojkabacteria bacterium]